MNKIVLTGLLKGDLLRMVRDRFLIGMVLYIFGLALLIRFALPWVQEELMQRISFDLKPWYPLLVSHVAIQLAGLMAGIVGGFLLLESKENRAARALLVTPLPPTIYLSYVISFMAIVSLAFSLLQAAVISWALPPWPGLLASALAGAPAAPIMGLFIATVASNKTEAFAYMKICAVMPILASGAYFLPGASQWLAGIYPPFWAAKSYWLSQSGASGWPLTALAGIVCSVIWLWMLSRAYLRSVRR